jgi:hypothetical protein
VRESRTHGSARGACDETHVPTAISARVSVLDRRTSSTPLRRPPWLSLYLARRCSAGLTRSSCRIGKSKENTMGDVRISAAFDANLPNLDRKVRINSFYDAQVFVRRWAIRDKDRVIRALLRRMERANSSETANSALEELKQELAARGLLPDLEST